jgi:hypothetical protein
MSEQNKSLVPVTSPTPTAPAPDRQQRALLVQQNKMQRQELTEQARAKPLPIDTQLKDMRQQSAVRREQKNRVAAASYLEQAKLIGGSIKNLFSRNKDKQDKPPAVIPAATKKDPAVIDADFWPTPTGSTGTALQTSGGQCADCGRTITHGIPVPGVGLVGSECAGKYRQARQLAYQRRQMTQTAPTWQPASAQCPAPRPQTAPVTQPQPQPRPPPVQTSTTPSAALATLPTSIGQYRTLPPEPAGGDCGCSGSAGCATINNYGQITVNGDVNVNCK